MDGWRLDDEQRREWLAGLIAGGRRLVAPVEEDGLLLFRPVSSADEIPVELGRARWSPKEFVFPSTEALFSYRLSGNEVTLEEPPADGVEQVLFALRPCDAAGLSRLDEVFLSGDADAAYAARRAHTVTVSLACEAASPECFCTAVGGSPAGTDGSDLQLVRLAPDGAWLLRALTERGAELVGEASGAWAPASDEDWAAAAEQQTAVESAIERSPLASDWAGVLEEAFAHPLWETVGERCLGCGICAYVCPSCSCFDVNDEGSAYCGTRCRLWDSCTFAQFTRHASGHNPRPTQPSRYRQRVLHKFAYFPLEHGDRFMCVGCGRCTVLCPVGIDIHQSVQRVATAAEEKAAA